MSDSQKFSYVRAMNNLVRTATDDAAALRGSRLPCHVVGVNGAVVTVHFDILPGAVQLPEVTVPVAGFEYIRFPIKAGDKGVTMAADVSLRGVSGMGTGLADLSLPPSLTALFFVPLASNKWQAADPGKITLYGPRGALIKTTDGKSSVSVDSDKIVLSVGRQTLELSASGLKLNGVNVGDTHTHTIRGVESGSSSVNSEVPQ